jgi:hypothetical protein
MWAANTSDHGFADPTFPALSAQWGKKIYF